MSSQPVTFLTPYWSGAEMMRIHLASIRRFHPDAPILVSKRGGDGEEMQAHAREFGIRYWLEECEYPDAYLRLLQRCETEYVCILDHDAILLSGLDPYLAGLAEGRYDVVGIEERIRVPDAIWKRLWPDDNGWLRFAPGCMAANFILFNWREFKSRWGLRGIWGRRPAGTEDYEFDYGIGQKLVRHHYLMPFHARKYGMGNLLRDGDSNVVWHQWYGSFRTRLVGREPEPSGPQDGVVYPVVAEGERAFLADYPDPDFSGLEPAWGPERDVAAEQLAIVRASPGGLAASLAATFRRVRGWARQDPRALLVRALAKLDRWWRLR
jgi:hypothetical protein